MDRLYDKLVAYCNGDYYPMHMPGHKRNVDMLSMENPYRFDITEIEGFDNLHQAEGILMELSQRICKLYGSRRSYPLINGSTAGILTALSVATSRGDKVLVARNAHKSVYHGVIQMGLRPVYIYPQVASNPTIYCGLNADQIEEALIKEKNVKAVIITSPTYEGIVSDINHIAKVVHKYDALLIVDEAHGAHFGFYESFPKSAIYCGADLVIQSFHKTLPSLTQTAVLHSMVEELDSKIRKYLAIYQTSSPSYVLLSGIDRCISILEDHADTVFHSYMELLKDFYHRMKTLEKLRVINQIQMGSYEAFDWDMSKIIISVQNTTITAQELHSKLREEYHIVMEMEAMDYVLGMTSICDTKEGFNRLAEALISIDREVELLQREATSSVNDILQRSPLQVMYPQEAFERASEIVPLHNSEGRIAATFVSLFPPGSPLLVPGELIDQALIDYIRLVKQKGIAITGLSGMDKLQIEVLQE